MVSASQRLFDAIGAQLILHQSFADEPPRVGADYEIVEIIGAGGFGLICRATQIALRRAVALKLFPLGEGDDGGVREALREARSLARLEHPGIVSVYAAGESEVIAGDKLACAYVEMQLIDGVNLREWLGGPGGPEQPEREAKEVLEILRGAGRALAHAHAEGMVHRDFKPENLMVDREGRPKVIDFGLALVAEAGGGDLAMWDANADALGTRATGTGRIRGTAGYMAPEASQGRPRAASDQFALAVVIREALTGRHPFAREAEANGPIPRGGLELFAQLRPSLDRAMSTSPTDRFASVAELCDALDAALAGQTSGRKRGARRSQRSALALGVIGSLGLLGVLGWRATDGFGLADSSEASPPTLAETHNPPELSATTPEPASAPEPEPEPVTPQVEPPSCADLDEWMGTWQATTKVLWTEYAYQFDWRVDHELALSLGERCTVTVTARKYPPLVEGEVPGVAIEATASAVATRDEQGVWRLPLRLAFADDTRTYAADESYDMVLLFDRSSSLAGLSGAFRKLNDDGYWIRLGVLAGARGVAPNLRSIDPEQLGCAARCRVQCAGAEAERACLERGCTPVADDPFDLCGPPSYEFRVPMRALVARDALRSGKNPFAQALERGGRAKQLADCAENARVLAGEWAIWLADLRVRLDLQSEGCELAGTITNAERSTSVAGYVTAAGTFVLTPDDPQPWLPEPLVLVGVGEHGPAFGTDLAEPPRPLRAYRSAPSP